MKIRNRRDSPIYQGADKHKFEHSDALILQGTIGKIKDDAERFRQKIAAERKALGLE